MEKDKFEDFFNYYLSDEFINNLELPERIGFTHFRGRTSKGGWRKIPVKISSKEELQKWIIKLGLVDLYYSTSEWLNPHKVSAKVGSGNYLCADNLILKNNLVFDIDCEKPVTIKGLDNARIACKEIHESISRMKKKGKDIENKYFAFSGSRGFRLVYDDKSYVMPSNYRDRLEKTEQNRKLFILELLKDIKGKTSEKRFKMIRGVIDQNITTNPLCIIRIIGSAHSKTRFISTKLPLGLLYKKVDTFINNIPYIGKIKPGILRNKEMTLEEENNLVIPPSPRSDILVDDVAGLASLPRNYFLTNRVLGVRKCFIPVLVYGKGYKKEVKILQKKYRLGKLFVFEEEDKTIILSFKTFQRRALQKMLNESSSKTKYDFLRRRRIIFPMSMSLKRVILGGYIKGVSRGHSIMFNNVINSNHMCGWDKVEIVRAERDI